MLFRSLITVFLLVFLSACTGKSGSDFGLLIGIKDPLEVAQKEFNQGLVMESRAHLLTIGVNKDNYSEAMNFLRTEVEPARTKLLSYYLARGKSEERRRAWGKAEESYRQAEELLLDENMLKSKRSKINIKIRQLRLDRIYWQRKREDKIWLLWKKSYVPPSSLLDNDIAFLKARHNTKTLFNTYADKTWELVEFYIEKDVPELAWLYATSYSRLKKESVRAEGVTQAMLTVIPKGIELPTTRNTWVVPKTTKPRKNKKKRKTVSAKQVRDLLSEAKWLKAREKALELKESGDAKADKLLEEVDLKITAAAEKAYQDGNLAFRSEKINDAVRFWQRAVDLKPDEQTYVDSLRRGKQIQERLKALKAEEK